MKKCHLLLLIFFALSPVVSASEIALTIDDAPRKDGLIYSGDERADKIISVLKKYSIQTAFFSNSKGLSENNGQARLKKYSDAGHLIANHTHSHPSLNGTSVKKFEEDISKAENLLTQYKTFVKWFRFPFLHEGNTIESRDSIRDYLKKNNYINGYVTVDNFDYFIDDLVQKSLASKKNVNMERACRMLVDIMFDGIEYYDSLAKKNLGEVRHVLLMHENDIEAFCLEKLILRLAEKGWKIVSPAKAFEDPILSKEPNTIYLNQGRVAALIHEKTGVEYRSKWESTSELKKEFSRRKIIEKK